MGGEFVRHVRSSSQEAHQYLDVNHPARGAYRVAAAVVGLLLAAVGVVALVVAGDVPFSGKAGHGWLGLTLNRAGGVFLLALAVLVIAAAALPGNAGATALTGAAVLMLVLGLAALTLNRTTLNVLAFSVVDVCVLWVFALAVLWCGMHTWVSGGGDGRTILGDKPLEYGERLQ